MLSYPFQSPEGFPISLSVLCEILWNADVASWQMFTFEKGFLSISNWFILPDELREIRKYRSCEIGQSRFDIDVFRPFYHIRCVWNVRETFHSSLEYMSNRTEKDRTFPRVREYVLWTYGLWLTYLAHFTLISCPNKFDYDHLDFSPYLLSSRSVTVYKYLFSNIDSISEPINNECVFLSTSIDLFPRWRFYFACILCEIVLGERGHRCLR